MMMSPKDPKTDAAGETAPRETTGPIVVDIGVHRIRRQLPQILPEFEAWCQEAKFDVQGEKLRARITRFLGHYARVNGGSDITLLNVPAFGATLDELMFSGETNDFLDMTHVFAAYLDFLHSTGRWSGTHEEFEQLAAFFRCFQLPRFEPDYSPIPELRTALITVPKLTEQEVFEAVSVMPLAGRLRSFLLWFGDKREITTLKKLNNKHVRQAAASLDVDALRTRTIPVGGQPKTGPFLFKSAAGVPRLALYWDAMVAAGLIELAATRAYPTRDALDFLRDPAANLVEVVRIVARNMYRALCVEVNDGHQGVELGYLTRYFLLEAAVEPISVEVLRHPVRGLDEFDPRGDPYIIGFAWRQLERLRDEGLVAIDSRLSIPPALLKPLVRELARGSEVRFRYRDPADGDPVPPGPPWA